LGSNLHHEFERESVQSTVALAHTTSGGKQEFSDLLERRHTQRTRGAIVQSLSREFVKRMQIDGDCRSGFARGQQSCDRSNGIGRGRASAMT
jgi:hypothetical protein